MIVWYDPPHRLARVYWDPNRVVIVAELGLAHVLSRVPDNFARGRTCIGVQSWKHHFASFCADMEWLRLLGHPFIVLHIRRCRCNLLSVNKRVVAARGRLTWTLLACECGLIFKGCYVVGRSPRRTKRAELLMLLLSWSQVTFIILYMRWAFGGWLALEPFSVLSVGSGRGSTRCREFAATTLR